MAILIGMVTVAVVGVAIIYVQTRRDEAIRVENWHKNRQKYLE